MFIMSAVCVCLCVRIRLLKLCRTFVDIICFVNVLYNKVEITFALKVEQRPLKSPLSLEGVLYQDQAKIKLSTESPECILGQFKCK